MFFYVWLLLRIFAKYWSMHILNIPYLFHIREYMKSYAYRYDNDNTRMLSWQELEWKNLYAVLEWHAVILKSPKNLDGLFWYGTHTCSLVIVEWKNGELWLVHVHEMIWKEDLIKFFWEFSGIKKMHMVWGSDITINLINETANELWIQDKEYIPWQYDTVVYREWDHNKIITTGKIPESFRKTKVDEISTHIKSRLYILFDEYIQNRKWWISLIIENK